MRNHPVDAKQMFVAYLRLFGLALVAVLSGMTAYCADSDITFTTLVTFNGTNGSLPMSGLMLAKDGNFYGTTYEGGAFMKDSDNGAGYGTAFKVAPEGKFVNLVSFRSGTHPCGNLVQGKDGNFYGTTLQGGKLGGGTVFRITTDGRVTTLYSFGDYDEHGGVNTNGWAPDGLFEGSDGNFYGVTEGYGFSGGGTVFKITPEGKFTTLIAFSGKNIARPSIPLLVGKDGNFYGTINGELFKMTLNGTITTAFSYDGATGVLPVAGLIRGKDGKFFGLAACGSKGGSILRMNTNGKFTMLAKISGECPSGELMQATDGNFYGANPLGGTNRNGTMFRLKADGTVATVFEFNGRNGNQPHVGLVQGKDGNLYGTTSGGFGSGGTIFRLALNLK